MKSSLERKVERTIPVMSRIDLISLVKLDQLFMERGFIAGSMSQLVNWIVDTLVDVLEREGVLITIDDVVDAKLYMEERGLMQEGVMKRGKVKLAHAIMFDSMRREGNAPEVNARRQFNTLHHKGSVKPIDLSRVNLGYERKKNNWVVSEEKMKEMVNYAMGLKEEDLIEHSRNLRGNVEGEESRLSRGELGDLNTPATTVAVVREGMTEEEYWEGIVERDKKELSKLNSRDFLDELKKKGNE